MSCQFKWGVPQGSGLKNKHNKFYKSFTYDGVGYCLYDTVYVNRTSYLETSVGKLVKIYENVTSGKKARVVWYPRPREVRAYLGDYKPIWNEVFLASGEGKEGTACSSWVHLENIAGKCTVVCGSNDRRNPRASEAELRTTDFIFYRTFDVGKQEILDTFPVKIDGLAVEHFFNQRISKKLIGAPNLKEDFNDRHGVSSPSKFGIDKPIGSTVREAKKKAVNLREEHGLQEERIFLKPKTSIQDGTGTDRSLCPVEEPEVNNFNDLETRAPTIQLSKKRKFVDDEEPENMPVKVASQLAHDLETRAPTIKAYGQFTKVTRSLDDASIKEKGKWFRKLPWEEQLPAAHGSGKLVLLENLDPSFTSADIQDLVRQALKMKVEVKMIQQTSFSSPYYGKSLVIFETKDEANKAISMLEQSILELADGRPILAKIGNLTKQNKQVEFPGHLHLEKLRLQRQNDERKKAVSTSHCSQPNTIEHVLAMEWCMLQEKSNLWWEALHKAHAKEIDVRKQQLKKNLG